MSNGEPIWNYCNECRNNTKHTILFSKLSEDEHQIESEKFQIVECNGCERLSFRKEHTDSWGCVFDDDDEPKVEIETYPGSLRGHASLNFHQLPPKIKDVYLQTLLAFKGKSNLLTGVGFRAIIEAVCLEEKIKGSNLEKKINSLAQNRLITEKEAERLHSIRFLGNDSVHEMEIPHNEKLLLALQIIEHLLKNLYLIDNEAKFMLDTIIKNYGGFVTLLWTQSERLEESEEKSLKEILGKHIRRVNLELDKIEALVIEGIKNGSIDFLKLGSKKLDATEKVVCQHYMFTGKKQNDDLPF
ncbi:MAG TPA: DUF4145 domain-containing protein [Bacteroidia bacterium]